MSGVLVVNVLCHNQVQFLDLPLQRCLQVALIHRVLHVERLKDERHEDTERQQEDNRVNTAGSHLDLTNILILDSRKCVFPGRIQHLKGYFTGKTQQRKNPLKTPLHSVLSASTTNYEPCFPSCQQVSLVATMKTHCKC